MKKYILSLLFLFILICIVTGQGQEKITSRFTSFYLGGSYSDFEPNFLKYMKSEKCKSELTAWIQNALSKVPQLSFIPTPQDASGSQSFSVKTDPNTLFIRGVISRADFKKVQHFSIDEYVFSTNVTLEFFDLASGEVFYTRTLTGQGFHDKPRGKKLYEVEKRDFLKASLKQTVAGLVKKIAEEYKPAVMQGKIVKIIDSSSVVIDLGLANGLYQGMTFKLYETAGSAATGVITISAPQKRLSKAKITLNQGKFPARGWIVKNYGVNRLTKQKSQTRFIVANFSLGDPSGLCPEFNIDTQSLGQWLHDGLSVHSGLFMLAPLLVRIDEKGKVATNEALWDAQVNYTLAGGLSQSAVIGQRAFPDVMILGLITHASVQRYLTPGQYQYHSTRDNFPLHNFRTIWLV